MGNGEKTPQELETRSSSRRDPPSQNGGKTSQEPEARSSTSRSGAKESLRCRQLLTYAHSARRLLRTWTALDAARRRYIRFMAGAGAHAASEFDLRLLFVSPDAT